MASKREGRGKDKASIVDKQLEDELRALGWRDDGNELADLLGDDAQALSPEFTEAKIQEFDFSAIGEIDESALQLTDDDFNDPNFEAALAELGWDDAGEVEVDDNFADEGRDDYVMHARPVPSAHAAAFGAPIAVATADLTLEDEARKPQPLPTQEETEQRVLELKRQALTLKKAGNQAEALKVLRQAKMLEEGYDMESHVALVAAVAQQPSRYEAAQQQPQQPQQPQRAARKPEPESELPEPELKPAPVKERQVAPAPILTSTPAAVAAPAPAPAPVQAAEGGGQMTPAQAKAMAVKCKKEGDTEGALKWMREAKRLEAMGGASSLMVPPTAAIVDRSPTEPDIFTPLERALNEAMATRLQEAKAAQAAGSKVEAVTKFREYKQYEQELGVLQSRRILQGARPALFEWHTTTQTVRVQNADLAADQMKLVIEEATGLQQLMAAHKSQQYTINYDLGYPKDQPYQGQVRNTSANLEAGTATFGLEEIKHVKRARSTIGIFGRKKATFELILHRGFFRSDIVVGKATVPLAELLTKCEIGGSFELMDGRKAAGARIKLRLMLREPLETPEAKQIVTRTLVIGPWPAPSVEGGSPAPTSPAPPSAAAAASAAAPAADALAGALSSPVARPGLNRQQSERAAEPTGPEFEMLTEREKKDPLSVEHLESNDVFEAEIQASERKIQTIPKDSEDRFQEELRLQLLQTKMNMLVLKVQREELQLDQYLAMVKNRTYRDHVLSRYLYAAGRKQEAAQVLRRMKIMQQEVQNAESGEGEEEEN